MVASYVAWRADQVLNGSYTLDIDSDNVGSCIFVQEYFPKITKQIDKPYTTNEILI